MRYEALVEDHKRSCDKRSTISDLEWTDELLRFYESDRVVRTPSAEQVRRPLNRSGMTLEALRAVARPVARGARAARDDA